MSAGLLVVVLTVADIAWNAPGSRQADWVSLVLVAGSLLVLLARDRFPVPVAVCCALALTALYGMGHQGELLNLPTAVALYAVASRSDRRTTVLTAVVAAAWSGILGAAAPDPLGVRGGSPVLEMIWPLVPLAFGEAARSRRELRAAARLEREQEVGRRVEAERVQLARDMHDVVAHTITAVNVHLTVATAAFDVRPQAARDALEQASRSTQEALRELRGTVALLRRPRTPVVPAPRLADVPGLAAVLTASGRQVELRLDTDGVLIGAATELVAYRIVQEAVTNVARHSTAGRVRISIEVTDDDLAVRVVDDGVPRTGTPAAGGGAGLLGMTERAVALGGSVRHGHRPGSGFEVAAVLPLHGGSR